MPWTSLAQRIAQLPLVLAGPIVRRVESQSVTIWLALKEPRTVTVRLYKKAADGELQELFSGTEASIRISDNIHIVAVTATTQDIEQRLTWEEHYYYNVFFAGRQDENVSAHLGTPGVLSTDTAENEPLLRITYAGHPLPSFLMPAENVQNLRIVHGSCRKPHGNGTETLSGIDTIIERTEESGHGRPQQLYMSGDQIYADDVAAALLFALDDAAHSLCVGNETELLPLLDIPAEKLLPGTRKKAATQIAKMTSGHTNNHLMSLAEYVCMYLFSWSDALWSDAFPTADEFWDMHYSSGHLEDIPKQKFTLRYNDEVQQLQSFRQHLPEVRRVLANIATYMICDDHDVTDDWFLDGAWCQQVLHNALGRRIVRNGLLAFTLFQAWGNTPEQFASATGRDLLAAINAWRGDETDSSIKYIERIIGMPVPFDGTGSLQRAEDALHWHYTYDGGNYQVLALDTRTQRHYQKPTDFPGLLSPAAMYRQIEQVEKPETEVTIIVTATPVIGIDFIETVQFWSRWQTKDNYAFDREAWALEWGTFQGFLKTISRRKRVVILSGDVHYAFGSSMQYWNLNTRQTAKIVNFTSSPFSNEGSGSQISVLAVGYPRLQSLLRRGKDPTLNFFVWDIFGEKSHTLNFLLTTIRKRLYRFWWAIPRLIAATRSAQEIILPAHGWLRGTLDAFPPDKSYRLRYLQNSLQISRTHQPRPHTTLARVIRRPLYIALGGLNIVQQRLHWLHSTKGAAQPLAAELEQTREQRIDEQHTHITGNLLEKTLAETERIERQLDRPRAGLDTLLFQYGRWLNRWKAGRIIVGYNNFGEISFTWNEQTQEVTQRLWWRDPEQPEQLKSTDYSDILCLPGPEEEPPLP